MPDVAFMIGPLTETDAWSKDKSQVDILFALRTGKESKFKEKMRSRSYIRKMLDKNPETKGLSFVVADWMDADKFYNGDTSSDPDFIQKLKQKSKYETNKEILWKMQLSKQQKC